ncbi:10899_t:CDS:2 [Diversispora eburnea]|uniref:10899_t:CDS:1 n=1 Tax=Diversispora eburnea TaxID=1213867 RepID=A0A9N8V3J4_9GLOM|nr:10899_t:CDS:2 [Diversispora eburnea]
MANATTSEECKITGDGDLVGVGVRISVYIQMLLAIIKVTKRGNQVIETMVIGMITSLALVISAIHQRKTAYLHYLLLIEVSQIVSMMIAMIYVAIMFDGNKGIKKKAFRIGILFVIVTLFTLCYNIWVWATVKWKMADEECGDQVKIFILNAQIDPTGWFRNFSLAMNCIGLVLVPITLYYVILWIATIETTIRKNLVSNIWGWNFGQVAAMTVAFVDLANALILFDLKEGEEDEIEYPRAYNQLLILKKNTEQIMEKDNRIEDYL